MTRRYRSNKASNPRNKCRISTEVRQVEAVNTAASATVFHMGSTSDTTQENEWETVWRLTPLMGEPGTAASMVQNDHLELTRFNDAYSETITNLASGEYVVFLFGHKNNNNLHKNGAKLHMSNPDALPDELKLEQQSAVSTDLNHTHSWSSTNPTLKARSILTAATFGLIGKREVIISWGVFTDKLHSGKRVIIFEENVVVGVDDHPYIRLTFKIMPSEAPASAWFSVKSTSTMTVICVTAQLFRKPMIDDETVQFPKMSTSSEETHTSKEVIETLSHEGQVKTTDPLMILAMSLFLGFALGFSSLPTVELSLLVSGLCLMAHTPNFRFRKVANTLASFN